MGARKKISAEKRKEALKTMYFAKLQNVPTSPRKMRLVADMIRGMEVNRALGVLKFSSKEAAARVEKLLRSIMYLDDCFLGALVLSPLAYNPLRDLG